MAAFDEDELTDAIEAAEAEADIPSLVKILSQATAAANETVGEAACDAVLRLSKQNPAHKQAFGDAGAPAALVALGAALVEEPAVCEVVLSCVSSLAADHPANQAAFGAAADGVGALIVACMDTHGEDEPTIQEVPREYEYK